MVAMLHGCIMLMHAPGQGVINCSFAMESSYPSYSLSHVRCLFRRLPEDFCVADALYQSLPPLQRLTRLHIRCLIRRWRGLPGSDAA